MNISAKGPTRRQPHPCALQEFPRKHIGLNLLLHSVCGRLVGDGRIDSKPPPLEDVPEFVEDDQNPVLEISGEGEVGLDVELSVRNEFCGGEIGQQPADQLAGSLS